MALWEITLPADEQVELALEYGGFPKDWNLSSTSQGKPEISETYLCLENQRLFPYLLNVLPGDEGYPTTVEITLPASMTAIPFGTSEAEVIAEHGDGTKNLALYPQPHRRYSLRRRLHPGGHPGRRHHRGVLLRPQAPGGHGGRRGGGRSKGGDKLLYPALRLSVGLWRDGHP